MKKNFKKFASSMLALVMAIGLAAPAFAATAADTATIKLQTNDGFEYDDTVDLDGVTTVYDAVMEAFGDLEPSWVDAEDGGLALNSLGGYETKPATATDTAGMTDIAWSTVNPGYGLVSVTKNDEGKDVYNYIYYGYDWTYKVNGLVPTDGFLPDGITPKQLYMNQVDLKAGDEVELSYGLEKVEWSTTDPWMSTYPYI